MRSCDVEIVALWIQSGAAAEVRHLPGPGGLVDQAAIMMDAFAVLTNAEAAWKRDRKPSE